MNLEKWYQLRDKTADLSLRERGILTGTVAVFFLFLWTQLYYAGYEKQHQQNLNEKSALTQESVSYGERLAQLAASLEYDPNAILREEQDRLKSSLQGLRVEIENRMSNLVAPEDMANLMKKVLSDFKGLTLLSAKNLAVEPLNISMPNRENSDKRSEASGSQAVIFTHGFEMELKGSYFQTIQYLQKLENLSGFYWRMLSYEVGQYPEAIIRIQLNTLSLEEDWIGV